MENANKSHGISLFALIAMVVSSAIGAGVFDLPTTLAAAATPGATLIAWGITAVGILALALSLKNLVLNKPNLNGISDYARAVFGEFAGFLSGWGYWLSAWLGNIAFATMMMSAMGYFFPTFKSGNSLSAVIVSSIISWLLTLFVVRGVESAAAINAIVTVCKLVPLVAFGVMAVITFKFGVFTQHFWSNFLVNTQGVISYSDMTASGILSQIRGCLMAMMWVFVGIEGAAMLAKRAKKQSDAGKATVIGLITLLFVYIILTMLPYGYLSQEQLLKIKSPGILYLFESMTGSLGGAFISIGMIITIFGAWLSWTILPAEATSQLAEQRLLPQWFGVLNQHGAPSHSLWMTQIFIQIFLISTIFTSEAYTFAYSLCTSAIVVCYTLVGAYQMKLGLKNQNKIWALSGFIALAFQVIALLLAGLTYLWLCSIVYAVGLIFYYFGRRENGYKFSKVEWVLTGIIVLIALTALSALMTGHVSV